MVEEDITIKHRTCVTVTCDTYDCVQLETALQTASLAGPDALCSRDHTPHFHWSPWPDQEDLSSVLSLVILETQVGDHWLGLKLFTWWVPKSPSVTTLAKSNKSNFYLFCAETMRIMIQQKIWFQAKFTSNYAISFHDMPATVPVIKYTNTSVSCGARQGSQSIGTNAGLERQTKTNTLRSEILTISPKTWRIDFLRVGCRLPTSQERSCVGRRLYPMSVVLSGDGWTAGWLDIRPVSEAVTWRAGGGQIWCYSSWPRCRSRSRSQGRSWSSRQSQSQWYSGLWLTRAGHVTGDGVTLADLGRSFR